MLLQPTGSGLAFVNYETGELFSELLKKFLQEKTRKAETGILQQETDKKHRSQEIFH